ncbi:signal-induced proliferation-associated 1-like protein 3 isoform X1 [Leucoraja erinacea]|uniref:signal-induced proliferation-associated 1-like protein 3 isoform X1 n=1 Tax=Leucoraja erinaceus TaxID=7782 RepID=UPI002454838B|nr:signal-induced proliferation-associated 1-like protein 3 isoform X1 [Leucoraja erinacea]XP_055519592.1 signal-induced proliferation-associated 1-like protein 3 isoform X1 [Leucoraja erinacea]
MTSYRPVQNEKVEVGGLVIGGVDILAGTSTYDYHASPFGVQNGNVCNQGEIAPRASSTPAMPKMGVRARIADWPPKRDLTQYPALSPARESDGSMVDIELISTRGLQNGQCYPNYQNASQTPWTRGPSHRPQGKAREVEFQNEWPRAPGKVFVPLRARSNSEVTLNEYDGDGTLDLKGPKHGSGMLPLREYGSTSSIDVHGVATESFFDMLKEYKNEKIDQRSSVPDSLKKLLRADPSMASSLSLEGSARADDSRSESSQREEPKSAHKDREKARKKQSRHESGESILKKLRSSKSEQDSGRSSSDHEDGRSQDSTKPWVCQKCFGHFDVQSILFDLNEVVSNRNYVAHRRNTTTGASAASATSLAVSRSNALGNLDSRFPSTEEVNGKENLELDLGDSNCNDLLLNCPHFRNETGGSSERDISLSKASINAGQSGDFEGAFPKLVWNPYCTNASISVLEVPKESQLQQERLKHFSIEHVDRGARYYQDYFHGKEHWNYFGVDEKLGPVAVSIKREKLEDSKEQTPQYVYRIIFRTSELITLRGAILEDAVPSTSKHGTVRGLPLKEVLETVIPELNIQCLRLAFSTPKVTEQLLKLDEQGLSRKHKVGILYCTAGQGTEEEMYNNEEAGPAFEEFLEQLGEKVLLKGFNKYAAQLDTKTGSTGTHSLYTTYLDYEIMFHVSTMLPYTPNNRQQLLRKRHIGNDIVTIIFQEPGALPFTPKSVRSHFQHVFVIVRVNNPCTEDVCYSVAVTRSKDVPIFGPPIPQGFTFSKSVVFRDFLLAKVINGEKAAHKSEKFHAMATRTRQEYLKDLAENSVTNTPVETTGKFNLMLLGTKKKEKTKGRLGAELYSAGAVTWWVYAQDYSQAIEVECVLGISTEYVVVIEQSTKDVVFNCFSDDVIGWTPEASTIKIFHGRGDCIYIRALEESAEDVKEIVQRLKIVTGGCETVDMTLRRNGLGQLGFHVKYDGTVAEVEEYGFAWQAGLRQGSRLVEICKVAIVTLTHDQMIDLLRTSVTVKVVIIPPHEDGSPRRGYSELYEMRTMDSKTESDSMPAGLRPPYRTNTLQWSSPTAHSALQAQRWPGGVPTQPSNRNQPSRQPAVPASYSESQAKNSKRPVSYPETLYSTASTVVAVERVVPFRNPSGSFSSSGSGNALSGRHKGTPDSRYGGGQHGLPLYEHHSREDTMSSGKSSSGGLTSQDSTMERNKNEPLWHVPAVSKVYTNSGNNIFKRLPRQELTGKDSPNRNAKGDAHYSSQSSSNTLSSNASSSHSDERWSDNVEHMEVELEASVKGASSDSGIDTTLYAPSPFAAGTTAAKPARAAPWRDKAQRPLQTSATYSELQECTSRMTDCTPPPMEKRRDSSPALNANGQSKGHRKKAHTPAHSTSYGLNSSNDSPHPRPGHTPRTHKTPPPDLPRPLAPCPQLSASVPKSFYSYQNVKNMCPAGWKISASSQGRHSGFTETKTSANVASTNVFGQPRLRASLRDLRSPRRAHKSTLEEDLKKLILLDSPLPETDRDMLHSSRKNLQRTLSDESICSGRREPMYANSQHAAIDQALPNDVIFTSTYPSQTLPIRRLAQPPTSNFEKKTNISASELSLTDLRDRIPVRRNDPGLMPLPDPESELEWSSLVNVAKAYEVQRAVSLFSLNDPEVGRSFSPSHGHIVLERQSSPRATHVLSNEPALALTGKVYQLEVQLKQLQDDLLKEKEDKFVLQAEVANLRVNNQRLQEESLSATEQLRRFAEIFSSSMEKK